MKKLFIICLLLLGFKEGYGQVTDTFYVYFSINDTRITPEAGKYIDSLIAKHKLAPGRKMMLLGYTDYLGSAGHNDSLSQERAKNVQNKLLTSGFKSQDIALCRGKGEILHNTAKVKGGYASDRKVLIITERTIRKDTAAKNKTIANTDSPEKQIAKPQKTVLDINQMKVNDAITLKNILFEGNEATITPSSMPEMEQLYEFLKTNKGLSIQIEGHICCLPPEEGTDRPYGKSTLSLMRAKSVYDYLVTKGIEKRRLKYIGLGNTKPLVSNEQTEEDMEQNRRVEVRVLSK